MEYVGFHDGDVRAGSKPAAKGFGVPGIKFNGDDAGSRSRKGLGDPPSSGSELQHEIGPTDPRLVYEFASEPPAA